MHLALMQSATVRKRPLARVGRMKCKYSTTYLHFVLLTLANVPLSSIPFLYRYVKYLPVRQNLYTILPCLQK